LLFLYTLNESAVIVFSSTGFENSTSKETKLSDVTPTTLSESASRFAVIAVVSPAFTTTTCLLVTKPSFETITVYEPSLSLSAVKVVPIAASVATSVVPSVILIEAPETLVVTVIAPSLKVGILSLSTIARNQCLWVCMRCGVTF